MSPTSSRRVSRRSFLYTTSTATLFGRHLHAKRAERGADPASIAVRRKAAWRRRPLILDDDGDLVYADESIRGPKAFLKLRMHDARAAEISSIAWCMMWGIAKKGKATVRYWQTQKLGIPFQKNMPDPTPVVADFAEAIRDGRKPLVDGVEGRRAVALITAIYESSRSGSQPVQIAG